MRRTIFTEEHERFRQLVAIAMSEPGAGSDLKQVKATARRDGDHYVLNATKPSSATASSLTSA